MSRPKLYLIDGHSFAYRAFYALPTSMMTTSGQTTNAIHGFATMVLSILENDKPEAIAVAFDLPKATFRHKKYKMYKANRPPSPDEFKTQVPLIKDFVKSLEIPIYEVEGFEADDVLGTLAKKAVKEGFEAKIITGDRDSLQLIEEDIHVILPQKGISEVKEFDEKEFEKKYDTLKPQQMIDLKALMGDASDNIPGVPGIGEKTAISLLKEYNNLDNIYKNVDKIPRDAVKKKLKANKKLAYLSKELAAIDCDVPLKFDIEKIKFNEINWDKAIPFFKNLELNSLVRRHQPVVQEGLFSETLFDDDKKDLDQEQKKHARLMKHLINPERGIFDEDINKNDIASISEYEKRLKEIDMYKLYSEVELPLADVLDDMEKNGVKIDVAYLAKMSKDLENFIKGLESIIYRLAGEKFNLNSPKQMSEIFFEKLKMPVIKKTKTGYSTDASVLEELSYEFDIASKILEYRQLNKLKTTYVDALPQLVDSKTNKLHTKFNQTATSTGRLSSSEPNLQNIPIRSDIGKKIRAAFIPEKEGNKIMTADYSQVELRILAHIANETALIKAFAENKDVHAVTAAEIFGVKLEKVTEEQRSHAKAVNFGLAYGMSARKLAQSTGVSFEEAQNFVDSYFTKYPKIKKYMDSTISAAKKDGHVETLLKRRRYFPDINSANKRFAAMSERAAINTPIQGSAADIIKLAMLRVSEEINHQKMKAKMILQVHDELVFDYPEDEEYDLQCLVKEKMENAYKLKVPLVVDIGVGNNWLEAK